MEGQITNGTARASVPANLPLMLHTYEGETMTAMTDGTSDGQGWFRFEDVAAAPGRSFEVMATYQGVSYFSPTLAPAEDQETLNLRVQIFETSNDPATLLVEQAHIGQAEHQAQRAGLRARAVALLAERRETGERL